MNKFGNGEALSGVFRPLLQFRVPLSEVNRRRISKIRILHLLFNFRNMESINLSYGSGALSALTGCQARGSEAWPYGSRWKFQGRSVASEGVSTTVQQQVEELRNFAFKFVVGRNVVQFT